jgi:hypothetical protein
MLTFVLAALTASAGPTLVHQGRLVDAQGNPLNGSTPIEVHLLDNTDTSVWSEPHTVVVEGGHYAVVLGTSVALDATDVARAVEVRILVNGTPMGPDAPLASVPRAIVADGAIIVSDAPVCGPTTNGALKWNGVQLQVCNGTSFVTVNGRDGSSPSLAASSCRQLHVDLPSLASGAYYIDPDLDGPGAAYHLWCDMVNDDGGWTLVASIQNGTSVYMQNATDVNVDLLDDALAPLGNAKLNNTTANLIGTEFRHTAISYATFNRYYKLSHALALGTGGQVTTADQCKTTWTAPYQQVSANIAGSIIGLGSSTNGSGNSDVCGGGTIGSWWSWAGNGADNGTYNRATNTYGSGWIYVR